MSYVRSVRLNQLLDMALNGATLEQLHSKCKTWGVTAITEKSYVNEVVAKVQTWSKKNG